MGLLLKDLNLRTVDLHVVALYLDCQSKGSQAKRLLGKT